MDAQGSMIGFIPTRNAEAARVFYEEALGFVSDDGFALVFHSGRRSDDHPGGNMVRVVRVGDFTPAPYTILGWEAASIQAAVENLAARGITFQRFASLEQDEAGIWTAPSGDRVAWFKDPDGNTLSLSQHS